MNSRIILLILVLLIQLNFFNLSIIPLSIIENLLKFVQWVMIFIGIILSLRKQTKFGSFFIVIGCSLLVNFMSSSYFRNQDILVSLKTSLFLAQIFFYYFLVVYDASIKSVEKLIVLFSVALFILFIAQYFLYPIKIFNSDIGVSTISTEVVRWTFYGQGFLSLGLLFAFNKFNERKNLKFLFLTIILSLYFLLQGSRSIIIAIVLAFLFLLYKNGYLKISSKNVAAFVVFLLFGILMLNIPQVNNVINYSVNRTIEDQNSKEDYVRFLQLDYFVNSHSKNSTEFILGSGLPGDSEYGRKMNLDADASTNAFPINWVDLGFIGLAIIVGFPFSISIFYFLAKEGFKKKCDSRFYYIQSWYVYLILSTIFYPTAFIGGNMIVIALTMYILYKGSKKKLVKNSYGALNYNSSL